MLKKIIINSAVFGIAPYLPRIISVFLLPILTKYLSETDYGIIGTVTAYTAALSAFATLGLTQILFNSFYHYKSQYKWLWRELYGFLQLWTIVFAFVQFIILYFLLPKEAESHKLMIIILSTGSLFFSATGLLGNSYYQLNQKPFPIAVRTVVFGIITILINYVFVVICKFGYLGYFWSTCIGSILMNVSYIHVLYFKLGFLPIYKFKIKTITHSLKVSLPIIPHTYSAYMLNTSNRLVMDRYHVPIETIGKFNIAQQFSNLMDSFTSAVNQAINPMTLNEIRENNPHNMKKLIYIYMIITLVTTFLFSLWLKEIFTLLISNSSLRSTYNYAVILIMAQNAKPLYVASSNIFFYYENTKSLLKITFVSGIISLLGYIIFIPLFSIWGAVVIYYIAMLYMGYAGFFFSFYKEKSIVNFPVLKIFIIIILMTLFVYIAMDFNPFIKFIISIFVLSVILFWGYSKKMYKL